MPAIAPLSAPSSVLSALKGLLHGKPTPVPTKARIVPAFNQEADEARWNMVEKLLKDDFENHHVEVLNQHTKSYQPNYIAHSLLSLYKVNASETILKERYDLESKMLTPVGPSITEINANNWKDFLGKGQSHYADYASFFLSEIHAKGIEPTVSTYLPTLIAGLGGDCFHPLVHLGLGLEFQQPLIVAQGLAFWSYTYAPIVETLPAVLTDQYETANIIEILQDAREDTRFDPDQIQKNWGAIDYHKRVRKAISSQLGANLAELVAEWKVEDTEQSVQSALEELVDATVLSSATTCHPYPQQLDFPLTHALIAAASLNHTLPHIPEAKDKAHLLRRFLLAFLALYVSQGRPTLHPDRLEAVYADSIEDGETNANLSTSPLGSPTLPNTPQLMAREWYALAGAPAHVDDDVHVMEVVAALRGWEAAFGAKNGLYIKAAKVVRSVVKTGSGEEWEFRGAGYPPASSFALEEEE
ncbi:uncharacterized protein EV422DRAFT_528085 [Fimicolochytrium jonesii]|uniref:uncharacterized protein n=1 Tax=Fimicolochytrium jonesii TaxID=1396493 RepID=UPI0022FDC16D|nr:uncharacterized protein EV422DRAFT_528085 [Fimicolochytrium jonesii]KAI8821420.1 hypothetical protein EV422DRAFT_528085 [Fimicolochytrium jonesii]